MGLQAVILIFLSTVMHASWNLLARRRRGEIMFIWRLEVCAAALAVLPGLLTWALYGGLPLKTVLCGIISGSLFGLYFACLARGYRSGDFTVVYPVARALPVLLVGFGDIVRGAAPSAAGWVGMSLVAAGCLIVPLQSFRDLRASHYINRASLWILLTALCTTGYSLVDKFAQGDVRRGAWPALLYCCLQYFVSAVVYNLLLRLFRVKSDNAPSPGWRDPAIAAALTMLSYWLILCAYQIVTRVSYVVAFRQFSIVMGVVAAFMLFREPGRFVRTSGAVVITIGLIVIGIWGGR